MKEMIELKDLLVLDLPYATGFLGTLLSLICNHIIYLILNINIWQLRSGQ